MTDFMCDEKRPFERRAGVLVENEAVAGNVHRTPPVKHGGASSSNFDIKVPTFRFGSGKRIGLPRDRGH